MPTSATSVVSHTAAALVGSSSVSAGLFLPSFLIQSTLTRSFATVLEGIGRVVGYTCGGLIGLTFDLSYKGLQYLCCCYLHLYDNKKLDPMLLQTLDPKFVKALLNLPEELFKEDKKTELEHTISEHAADKMPQSKGVK